MHKTFFLSKEVSGVYELCWCFSNNQLSHDPLFFHETYLFPIVSSLIHSSFTSAMDLSSTVLEHLSKFSLSSVSHCLLCSYALLFSGFLPSLLLFLALLFLCIHWTPSLHYQLLYSSLRTPYHGWRLPRLLLFLQYTF
jgi:hypothetical protein